MFKKLKAAINNYLLSMAKQNEETFGKDRMDCCNLNKKNNTK